MSETTHYLFYLDPSDVGYWKVGSKVFYTQKFIFNNILNKKPLKKQYMDLNKLNFVFK